VAAPIDLQRLVRDVPDWPEPGVVFKDITPLLADPDGFAAAVAALAGPFDDRGITKVVGIEARGFLIGAPVALHLGAGFVPARKPGKLPGPTESEAYALEYGTDRLEIHADAIQAGEQVLIVDDVIATGGTAAAALKLMETIGAQVAGFSVFIELAFLKGKEHLPEVPYHALLVYD
jgi:adenine phosphoribosyltransferase